MARIRQVYNDWCGIFNKEPSDARFETFASNYITMEAYAIKSGERMQFNEWYDCTAEEYNSIMSEQERVKAESEQAKVNAERDREQAEREAKIAAEEARLREIAGESILQWIGFT